MTTLKCGYCERPILGPPAHGPSYTAMSDREKALVDTMCKIRRMTSDVYILNLAENSLAAYWQEKGLRSKPLL